MVLWTSIEDLMKLPHFEGYTIVDMLSVNNDAKIKELFYQYGIDKNKPLIVQACLHRNNSKQQTVNFRYIAEERTDSEWINSGKSSIEVRINRHRNDPTLVGELSQMADLFRTSRDNVAEVCASAEAKARKERKKDFLVPLDYQEEMQETIGTIRALQHLQESIRGYISSDEDVLFDLRTDDERLQMDDEQDNRLHPDYKEWLEQQKEEGNE